MKRELGWTCFVQATRLSIPTYLGGVMYFAFFFWSYLMVWLHALVINSSMSPLLMLAAAGFAIAGWSWYVLVRILYTLILKLLWSKPPQWLQVSPSKRSTLTNYAVIVFATLPVALIYALKMRFNLHWLFVRPDADVIGDVMLGYFWLWWMASASCYSIARIKIGRRAIRNQHNLKAVK